MATTSRDPRGLLGLGADAEPAEVEAQYEELQGFLDLRKVPKVLRPWALRQRVLVDEAYAAAIGEGGPFPEESPAPVDSPDEDAVYAFVDGAAEEADDGARGGSRDDGEDHWADEATRDDSPIEPQVLDDRPRARDERSSPVPGAHSERGQPGKGAATFEIVTEDRQTGKSAPGRPSSSPRGSDPTTDEGQSSPVAKRKPRQNGTPGETSDRRPTRRRGLPIPAEPWRQMLLGVVLGALILGGIFVATRGLPSIGVAAAQSSATASQQAQVDEKRAAELKGIVAGDGSNRDALFELGEMYIQAGRWQDSLDWFTKLLAVDSGNLHARTDVGTDNFNLGRYGEAKAAWEEVARRSPNDPQIHYNLGFLYASPHGKPADLAAARQEWQKVIELAPNTELAKEAQNGLDTLAKQSAPS